MISAARVSTVLDVVQSAAVLRASRAISSRAPASTSGLLAGWAIIATSVLTPISYILLVKFEKKCSVRLSSRLADSFFHSLYCTFVHFFAQSLVISR